MFNKITISRNEEGSIVTAKFPTISVACENDDDLIIYLKLANAIYESFGFEPADDALSTIKAIVMTTNQWTAGESQCKKIRDAISRNSILSRIENIPIETEKSELAELGQHFKKIMDEEGKQ